MTYIGIDPGKTGSMAVIKPDSIEVIPYDPVAYLNVLLDYSDKQPCKCCLEHVSARPGQGVTSMFHFGENFGWVQGMLDSFGISYELVRPQKWKKEFSITGDKNSSIAVCKRLFPDVSLRRTDKCRKDDDNMAEALLLAEYARRKL